MKQAFSLAALTVLVLVVALLLSLNRGMVGRARAETLSGTLIIAGSTSVQPLAEVLAEEFMAKHPRVRILVQGGGSSAGIAAAKSGAAQIGTSSRELKPEERGLHAVQIALDGIAVIVHPSNPVTNLSLEQLRRIYAGEVRNWKEVGGPAGEIMVVTREAGSGTRGAFEELVMKGKAISGKAIVQGSTGAVRSSVAQARGAVGYVSLGALDGTVKTVSLDGVRPTGANVKKKVYKLARPFLFLTKSAPTGLSKAFIDFVLSKEGQQVVAEEFIPVK
ncbi:MAG: phosphate ABC transporter substrate-binding protein [Betaproteobacteria bacterium]